MGFCDGQMQGVSISGTSGAKDNVFDIGFTHRFLRRFKEFAILL